MLYPFFRLCRPARSPASCGPAAHKKRGFNLIESAIVLGVVGLVIGGIWVAASEVRESFKGKTTAGMVLRARYRLAAVLNDVPAGTYPDGTNITSFAIGVGALPDDGKSPYGGFNVFHEVEYGRSIEIRLNGLNYGGCFYLVKAMSDQASNSGLRIMTFWPYHLITSFPMSMATIKSECDAMTGSVGLKFAY